MKASSIFSTTLIIISLAMFIACGKSEGQETTDEPITETSTAETAQTAEATSETPVPEAELPEEPINSEYLARYEHKHAFSDPKTEDTFLLTASGENGLEASNIVLSILNAAGVEIYREEFQGYDLIDYGIADYKGTRDEYVKGRMEAFFEEENFTTPAIKSDEEYDEDFSDETIWKDIKANPDAIGFFYLLGVEDGRSIAWSSSQQKTVLYFNCC